MSPRGEGRHITSPADAVYHYSVRDCVRQGQTPTVQREDDMQETSRPSAPLAVGDAVWMRRRGTRCSEMSQRGIITRVVSDQVVEVDGAPWHVRNVRRRSSDSVPPPDGRPQRQDHDDDELPLLVTLDMSQPPEVDVGTDSDGELVVVGDTETLSQDAPVEAQPAELRRSGRDRRAPDRWGYTTL